MKKLSVVLLSLLFQYGIVYAQWNAGSGVAALVRTDEQRIEELISDKQGGAWIICEEDYFGADDPAIVVQHIDKDGYITLAASGVQLNTKDHRQYYLGGYATKEGNLLVYYQASHEADVGVQTLYLQQVTLGGTMPWGDQGKEVWAVPLHDNSYTISLPFGDLVETTNDECFLAFAGAKESFADYDIYIQKMDASGNRLWGDTAMSITENFIWGPSVQIYLYPAPDGGAFVTYQSSLIEDIHVQGFTSDGTLQFPAPGIAVQAHHWHSHTDYYDSNHDLIAYEGGFAFYVAVPLGDQQHHYTEITIQTFDAVGRHTNGPWGIIIDSTHANAQTDKLVAAPDGSVVYLYRHEPTFNAPLYINKATVNGEAAWAGEQFLTEPPSTLTNLYVGEEEYFVTWDRGMQDSVMTIQCIDESGNQRWTNDRLGVGAGSGFRNGPVLLPDTTSDACLTCWQDSRNDVTYIDIFCARIEKNGVLSAIKNVHVNELSDDIRLYPNPARSKVVIEASPSVVATQTTIYNALGKVMFSADMLPPSFDVSQFPGGIYLLQVRGEADAVSIPFIVE